MRSFSTKAIGTIAALLVMSTIVPPARASGLGELVKAFEWLIEHRPRLGDLWVWRGTAQLGQQDLPFADYQANA